MQPTQRSMLLRTSSGTSPRTTTSETAKRPPGLRTRNASREHAVLVGGEVDDAVGDDDVDGVVGKRNASISPLRNSTFVDACLPLVFAREGEHFVGHVEAVGFAGGTYALR